MPIYMDLHSVPGVNARDVALAHQRDLLIEEEHGCKCMTYWIDEKRGNVFCLIDAPNKHAVVEMHNNAHGLIPHNIIEVNSSVVESFLGRISDPEETVMSDEGIKVFNDPSFRILLVTKTMDPVLLQYNLGKQKATELLHQLTIIIRQELAIHNGIEAEFEGHEFVASFTSATKAVSCAIAIQKKISNAHLEQTLLKISIHAGEPVSKSKQLFGDTILMAQRMCTISNFFQIAISTAVKELVSKDYFENKDNNLSLLSPQDESFLNLLFNTLEESWQVNEVTIPDYCQKMAMSKSQLYRKTIALTGLSPNEFLHEFRLEKARELLKKQQCNISQITFNTGFSSPSYFTKCFKKKYMLLPMAYLDLL